MPGRVHGLVSVVIPAFDAERWIGAAIESALAQSHPDVEVIVVDNGSTDGTVDVVGRMPGVRLVRCAIRGPSAARNAGLDAARGEFVQFLDADDLLAPGKVRLEVECLRATGADVAWGSYVRFDDGAAGHDPFGRGILYEPRIDESDVARSFIEPTGFLSLACALFRQTPRVAPVRFDSRIRVIEDVRFLLQLAVRGATFRRIASRAPTFAVREHPSPRRASRIGEADFWEGCAANARFLHAHWIETGVPLTNERRHAIASVWLDAAEVFWRAGDPRLERTLEWLSELDPTYLRRLRNPHRLVAPLIGYRATLALADATRRVRDMVVRRPR